MKSNNFSTYTFSESGRELLCQEKRGKDWPVVYLIHNKKELYVGETSNIYNRFGQHLQNPERQCLTNIEVLFDDEFNKSAILDIEQFLIQLFAAENIMSLQNKNGGQSEKHDYYQREKYLNKIDDIWNKIIKLGLSKKDIDDIKNTDLFKYSPYNTLTTEQSNVCDEIIEHMFDCLTNNKNGTCVVHGIAGTGKTIVLINIIYKLINASKFSADDIDLEDKDEINYRTSIYNKLMKLSKLKIAYVVPMSSMRDTLGTVFKLTGNGLKKNMVIGPFDVIKEHYDIVFVDEAHRLTRYKNISYNGAFKNNAKKCGLNYLDCSQLDMIIKNSKYRVLVYDANQTVKSSDLTNYQFIRAINKTDVKELYLSTQMRCNGGSKYTEYIDNIFAFKQKNMEKVENYDFKLFDDVDEMVQLVKNLDKQYGLCRNVAGFAWPWDAKDMDYDYIIKNHKEDIHIGKYNYVWNTTNIGWLISANAVNEIGCIHTVQGYDINYVGVIFGREIDWDTKNNRIIIYKDNYYDVNVKKQVTDQELEKYILNSYKVIMSRGIKGCYVYACNKNLRDYLKKFIEKY